MTDKKKGFTLVEIIVVLIIISVLLAIAIPTVVGYVQKANDEKLIIKARNVLTAARGEAVQLYAEDGLERLTDDTAMHEKIIKIADIDGEIMKITLNKKRTSSGDFIVKIDNHYVYYDDEKNAFCIRDNMIILDQYDKIRQEIILNSVIMNIINDYFNADSGRTSIDSEGTNFGHQIMNILEEKGYDTSGFSFRIYHKPNDNTITISNRKITNEMESENQYVEVYQYDYGSDGTYRSDPVIKTANVPVATKLIDNKTKIPYLKLDSVQWMIITP